MGVIVDPAMTLASAVAAGLSKEKVYRMAADGGLERVGRGVYVRSDVDPALQPLAGAAAVKPASTVCLTSALVLHELSDDIPRATDIALPRGTRHPAGFDFVVWHSFDPSTFDVGRERLENDLGLTLWVYSPERTIVDAFRLAHLEGEDVALEALRRWARRPQSSPSTLLGVARNFPRAAASIRRALEVLL